MNLNYASKYYENSNVAENVIKLRRKEECSGLFSKKKADREYWNDIHFRYYAQESSVEDAEKIVSELQSILDDEEGCLEQKKVGSVEDIKGTIKTINFEIARQKAAEVLNGVR